MNYCNFNLFKVQYNTLSVNYVFKQLFFLKNNYTILLLEDRNLGNILSKNQSNLA
jgi:hypothetical protein